MKKLFLAAAFSLMLISSGCGTTQHSMSNDIQDAFPESIQFSSIYHLEIVKDGVLVFYQSNSGIDAGFIRQTSNGWKWVIGGGTVAAEKNFDWLASNDREIPLFYVYGVVNHPGVEKLLIRNAKGEKAAKIVTLENGLRVWFTFYDEQITTPFEFIGLDAAGNEIFKR